METPLPGRPYGGLRDAPDGVRHVRAGALEAARTTHSLNGSGVARRTGISRQTINRWVRGDWASDPEAQRVVAFCTGLGVDPSTAFRALEWDQASPSPSGTLDPDIAALARRLADPAIGDQEKFHIRETVRYLAYRPAVAFGGLTGAGG